MKSAKVGNTVKVHYTGKVDNGMVFDSPKEGLQLNLSNPNGKDLKAIITSVG